MFKKVLFVFLLTLLIVGCSSDKVEKKNLEQSDSGYKGTLSIYSMDGKNIVSGGNFSH